MNPEQQMRRKIFQTYHPKIPLFGEPAHVPITLLRRTENDAYIIRACTDSNSSPLHAKATYSEHYPKAFACWMDPDDPLGSLQALIELFQRNAKDNHIPVVLLYAIEQYPKEVIPWIKTHLPDAQKWLNNPIEAANMGKNPHIAEFVGWKYWIEAQPVNVYQDLLRQQFAYIFDPKRMHQFYRKEVYCANIRKINEFPQGPWLKDMILDIYRALPENVKNVHAHALLIYGKDPYEYIPYFDEFVQIVLEHFSVDANIDTFSSRLHPFYRDDWLKEDYYPRILDRFLQEIQNPHQLQQALDHPEIQENSHLEALMRCVQLCNDPTNSKHEEYRISYDLYCNMIGVATPQQYTVLQEAIQHWYLPKDTPSFLRDQLITPRLEDIAHMCQRLADDHDSAELFNYINDLDPKWLSLGNIKHMAYAQVLSYWDPSITSDKVKACISKTQAMQELNPDWSWQDTLLSEYRPVPALEVTFSLDETHDSNAP